MGKAQKLTDIILNSVDLCAQGANPYADIKILKCKDGEKNLKDDLFTKLCDRFRKSKFPSEEVIMMNKAMMESTESIEKDTILNDIEKFEMLKENMEDFTSYFAELSKKWDNPIYETEDIKGMSELNDVIKGINVEEMEDTDSKILKAILSKYQSDGGDPAGATDSAEKSCKPKTQKAEEVEEEEEVENPKEKEKRMEKSSDSIMEKAYSELKKEFEDMKKAQEMNEIRKVAEEYVCIGKKVDELAPILYDLKKAGGEGYQTFIDTLNQYKETKLAMNDGILKTYGSDKALPIEKMDDLGAAVAQIRKADPKLSQAEAIVKAYELNPELPEIM